jgi:hypothetical protein
MSAFHNPSTLIQKSRGQLEAEIASLKQKLAIYSLRPCTQCGDKNCTFNATEITTISDDTNAPAVHNALLSNVGSMISQARDKIIVPENDYVEIIIKQLRPALNKKRKIAHTVPMVNKHASPMYQQNQWAAFTGYGANNSRYSVNEEVEVDDEAECKMQYKTLTPDVSTNMRWQITIKRNNLQ